MLPESLWVLQQFRYRCCEIVASEEPRVVGHRYRAVRTKEHTTCEWSIGGVHMPDAAVVNPDVFKPRWVFAAVGLETNSPRVLLFDIGSQLSRNVMDV
jgi:hypothetical protein